MIDGYRYAVQLLFDGPSERLIKSMIDELRSLGLVNESFVKPTYQPHLSLAAFREMDQVFAEDAVDRLASEFTPFELQFTHLQTFSAEVEAVCLGIHVTPGLRSIHQGTHQLFAGRPEASWHYYLSDAWTPHCGLLIDTDKSKIAAGVRHLEGRDLPCLVAETVCMTGFKEKIERGLRSPTTH
jgi:2'-5' RNA ligase